MISNTHINVPHASVKRWNPGTKAFIKLDYPNYITKYNKHADGIDSLDATVGIYRIDVSGLKWYWPHYINTIDVLKSTAFKVFKLSNPDVKMDFLGFKRRIVMHYLKLAKLKKQIPTNIIYPRKRSWRDIEAVAVNERTQGQHYLKRSLQKRCQVCPKKSRTRCPICKVVLCVKFFIWRNKIFFSSLYEF